MATEKVNRTELSQSLKNYTDEVRKAMDSESMREVIKHTYDEEAAFRAMLPDTGFFGDYMRYTDRQESPDSYHFWTAATVLGGAIQRRGWINKGVYKIFAPVYTILVGPSGITRKSRAMKLGLELLEGFDWANVLADKTTPEALLESMMFGAANMEKDEAERKVNITVDNTAFVAASELAVFLNKQTYTSGMVALLTDLYDCPQSFRYVTRNKKPIILKNVALSFLGASTPEWLATNLPEAAFEGGFMSRIIFIVRNMRSRFIAFPEDPPEGAKEQLQKHLIEIRRHFIGNIELTAESRSWFDRWYLEHELEPKGLDYNMLGFIERKPDTVLKLAMLLTAGSDPRSKYIELATLKQAYEIVTWTQAHMFRAFENIELSHIGQLRQKVKNMLEANNGSIMRRDVMRKLGGKISGTNDLAEVERIMCEADEMVVDVIKQNRGRPKVVYRYPRKDETLDGGSDYDG